MLIAQTATHTIEITCATHKQVQHEVQGATHPIGGLNIQFNLLLILLKNDRSVLGFNFCLVFLWKFSRCFKEFTAYFTNTTICDYQCDEIKNILQGESSFLKKKKELGLNCADVHHCKINHHVSRFHGYKTLTSIKRRSCKACHTWTSSQWTGIPCLEFMYSDTIRCLPIGPWGVHVRQVLL